MATVLPATHRFIHTFPLADTTVQWAVPFVAAEADAAGAAIAMGIKVADPTSFPRTNAAFTAAAIASALRLAAFIAFFASRSNGGLLFLLLLLNLSAAI